MKLDQRTAVGIAAFASDVASAKSIFIRLFLNFWTANTWRYVAAPPCGMQISLGSPAMVDTGESSGETFEHPFRSHRTFFSDHAACTAATDRNALRNAEQGRFFFLKLKEVWTLWMPGRESWKYMSKSIVRCNAWRRTTHILKCREIYEGMLVVSHSSAAVTTPRPDVSLGWGHHAFVWRVDPRLPIVQQFSSFDFTYVALSTRILNHSLRVTEQTSVDRQWTLSSRFLSWGKGKRGCAGEEQMCSIIFLRAEASRDGMGRFPLFV